MNIWKILCGAVLGGAAGAAFYRKSMDAGKALSPIATPLVEGVLASKGLPRTGQAALALLTNAAQSGTPLEQELATGLAAYVGQHIALVPPPPN